MQANSLSVIQTLYKWAFLFCLAVLPMSNTIALRNVLLALLLALLLLYAMVQPRELLHSVRMVRPVPWALLVWFSFLLIFPLWALDSAEAWANLRGQWGASIIAWLIGLGAVLVLGRRGPGLWALACASGLLVGLHLLLTLLAWAGVFGERITIPRVTTVPPEIPADVMWRTLVNVMSSSSIATWHWQDFPWGFRGFDPNHGNLGYTASQTVVLLIACFTLAVAEQKLTRTWLAGVGVAACFFSVVIANSRGSVIYILAMLLFAVMVYSLRVRRALAIGSATSSKGPSLRLWGSLLLLGVVLTFTLVHSLRNDIRWKIMVDGVRAGFLVEDPVGFLCEGLGPQAKTDLLTRLAVRDTASADLVVQGLSGDGGRVLLMRAGIELVLRQPVGLDGSRNSYKKLMAKRCGHPPVVEFAHAHQAWIDTALALGWAGVLLFAVLMLYFVRSAWRGLAREHFSPWAFALFLISIFWFLRGFADSLYREHYLQMQALLLSYLYGWMNLKTDDAA